MTDVKAIALRVLAEKSGTKYPTFVAALKQALQQSGFAHINGDNLAATVLKEGYCVEIGYQLPGVRERIKSFLLPEGTRVFFNQHELVAKPSRNQLVRQLKEETVPQLRAAGCNRLANAIEEALK